MNVENQFGDRHEYRANSVGYTEMSRRDLLLMFAVGSTCHCIISLSCSLCLLWSFTSTVGCAARICSSLEEWEGRRERLFSCFVFSTFRRSECYLLTCLELSWGKWEEKRARNSITNVQSRSKDKIRILKFYSTRLPANPICRSPIDAQLSSSLAMSSIGRIDDWGCLSETSHRRNKVIKAE